jgi:sirohydrochlorin ferrochelatase
MATMTGPALLTIAHGTRDPRGPEEMSTLVGHLRDLLGVPVANGWLEGFAEPDAVTAARSLLNEGADELVTLPLLVLGAGHAKTDVAEAVQDVRAALPRVTNPHAAVLGLQPVLFALARERIDRVSDPATREDEVLLVTGAGSSDPDANGDLAKAARFLAESTGHRWTETAYAGVTWPRADVALRRLHAAGARRVVRFSWSLLAGLLERRVTDWADEIADDTGMRIIDAGRFGPDPKVAHAVAMRYREAMEGDPRMNCDLCQYRMPVAGREARAGAPSAGGTGALLHPDVVATTRR